MRASETGGRDFKNMHKLSALKLGEGTVQRVVADALSKEGANPVSVVATTDTGSLLLWKVRLQLPIPGPSGVRVGGAVRRGGARNNQFRIFRDRIFPTQRNRNNYQLPVPHFLLCLIHPHALCIRLFFSGDSISMERGTSDLIE